MNQLLRLGHTAAGDLVEILFSLLQGKHKLFRGKSGSGKTVLLAMVLAQIIVARIYSVNVIDLGGDPFLFHFIRQVCIDAGVTFRFFSLDENDGACFFNPFQSARSLRSNVARVANLIAAGMGFIYQEGYGSGYYTRLNLVQLIRAAQDLVDRGVDVSVVSLGEALARLSRIPSRTKEAAEALFAMEQFLHYPQLVASEDNELNIDIARSIERGECNYFYLPTLLESVTARAMAALVMWCILVECVKRRKLGLPRRPVIVAADEFQQMIGGKNFEDVLTLGRKFHCEFFLSHQTSAQLILREADLRPIVTDNTSLRIHFTLPTKDDIDEVINHSKSVVKLRKSTTARGLGSSVTMQENELPALEANHLKDISGTFGHAVLIRELGDGHYDPIHLVCEPPVSKEKYDELADRPIAPRGIVVLPKTPKLVIPRSVATQREREARKAVLLGLLEAKREALHGWRKQMPSSR